MKLITILLSLLLLPFFGNSQSIEKFSIDSGGALATAGNIEILYTIGEVHVGERAAGNIKISEGFINPVNLLISINPNVFLQGPYTSPDMVGLMNDDIRTMLSTTSPYPDGRTCDASVFTVTGQDAIVDWVIVELRDATDRAIIIESRSALLQRDGDVVEVDGTSGVSFLAASDSYYVLVNHRNHLGILSANPIAVSGTTSVDLSSNPSLIFGGVASVIDFGDGTYAAIGGDNVTNGQIQNADVLNIFPEIGNAGYINQDIDLNGQVQNSDVLLVLPNVGKAEQFND